MKTILVVLIAASSSACLSHKDLAQVKADAFQHSSDLIQEHKIEEYVKSRVNLWFYTQWSLLGVEYIEIIDLEIIKSLETSSKVTTYQFKVIMFTEKNPYVKTVMTAEVIGDYEGVGQFTFPINPYE
jgi:hypothetical protein